MKTYREIPVGTTFGRWTVTGTSKHVGTHLSVEVTCACGTIKFIRHQHLLSGRSVSCGCFRKEFLLQCRTTHGLRGTKLYTVWTGMKERCQNVAHKNYADYGGRGISICDEWQSFEPFAAWAFAHGYEEGLQIDRIDNGGGYSPANCHFVTRSANNRNKRNNLVATAFGETKCAAAWAEDARCVVSYQTLLSRLNKYRWDINTALTTPARERTLK